MCGEVESSESWFAREPEPDIRCSEVGLHILQRPKGHPLRTQYLEKVLENLKYGGKEIFIEVLLTAPRWKAFVPCKKIWPVLLYSLDSLLNVSI